MTQLEKYISSYFGVDDGDLAIIAPLFKHVKLQKADYFLKTGKLCEKLCFIESGLLRIFVPLENNEVTQWISTKGYFVTDLSSLIFNTPARWTIQALTDADLFVIDKKDYNNIGNLVSNWHLLEKMFLARCFTLMEDRIFSHLSMTAEKRYQFFFIQNKELFNQVPLQYIASLLGMTPETFSRIRKKNLH